MPTYLARASLGTVFATNLGRPGGGARGANAVGRLEVELAAASQPCAPLGAHYKLHD